MRAEALAAGGVCLLLFGIAGLFAGHRKGVEWGVGVFATGVCLAFLFPWDILFE